VKTLIVPDAHGRYDLVRKLLENAGVIDSAGGRVYDPEVLVVQTGNLIGGEIKTRDEDAALLRKANSWFDVVLVGSHEHGYFGGQPFSGFQVLREVERLIRDVPFRPGHAVGGTLVTHAGVAEKLGMQSRCAADAAVELAEAWTLDTRHPFFSTVSRSFNGPAEVGGVLWSDGRIARAEDGTRQIVEKRERRYSQAYGHASVADAPLVYGEPDGWFAVNVLLADSRSMVALWLDGEGKPLTAVHSGT
jgi:hypothetical protein